MRAALPFAIVMSLSMIALISPASSQPASSLDSPLPSPNQGFRGLDAQSVSGESKTYTISLPENASYLFAGVLAREGNMLLEVNDWNNNVYPSFEGSAVIANAQAGTYTVTVTGTGKFVIFWDYLKVQPAPQQVPGKWADEVKQAYKVNMPGLYGQWWVEGIPVVTGPTGVEIKTGSTTYFMIDPKGFNTSPFPPTGKSFPASISVKIEDWTYGEQARFTIEVFKLSANNDEISKFPVSAGTGGMYSVYLKNYTQAEYDVGVKFLIKAAETGLGNTIMNVKWW